MKLTKRVLLPLFFILVAQLCYGTHIVGSTINYNYLGGNKYSIDVILYRDCRTSNPPIPVPAPDRVIVNVRTSKGDTFELTILQSSVIKLELPLPKNEPCARPPDVPVCVEEYHYKATFDQFPTGVDYYLFFSLCCRNSTITNLDPEQQTETIYTKIPNRKEHKNISNAQFTIPPPSYVCGGKPFEVKNDYIDADGDKVVYELYTPNAGPRSLIYPFGNIYYPKVSNDFPVFDTVTYSTVNINGKSVKFSGQSPMNAQEVIDPDSGNLDFFANTYGQFVVGIKMKEYRHDTLINETLRDYQFNVVKCPPPDVAALNLPDICQSLKGTFANSGTSGPETGYYWNFGDTQKAPGDTSNLPTPKYNFSKPGNYTITLVVNPRTKCADTATQQIKISKMKADFSSSGDTCVREPVSFTDKSTFTKNSPIKSRVWTFGDGGSSTFKDPTYAYQKGGKYNILYIITDSIGCKDTVKNVIKVVQEFPNASILANDTVCKNNSNIQLNGTITNAGGGVWTGGGGLFNPNRKTLTAIYTPTQSELDAGSLSLTLKTTNNGKCGADSTQKKIVFISPPIVNAALTPYSPICQNNIILQLKGRINPTKFGIKWTAGGGKFIPNDTDPLAKYVPSSSEIAAKKVNLTITSTNNGGCLPVTDKASVDISPAPTIKAGNDTIVCVNSADIELKGSVTVAQKILWRTGGDGIFVGGASNLKTSYKLGDADKKNGLVSIILETKEPVGSTYPQNCLVVGDTMYIKIIPATLVQAGTDLSVCSNNPKATLKATIKPSSGLGTGTWAGGKGLISPNLNSLAITYTPTDSEVTSKSVKLFLTSTNNGKCSPVTDTVKIVYTPSPNVNSGIDASVCKNNPVIFLNGAISGGASSGTWSGGKGVYSPDSTSLIATYTPTATEIVLGSLKFSLISTNNGTCLPEKAAVTYKFNDLPKIDAGSPIISCKNNPVATLNAIVVQGATSVRWSGGKGVFTPNDTTLNASYTATAAEASTGKLILTASSIGNGNCKPVTDTVSIRFIESPTATPGTAGPVCASNKNIKLNGNTSTGKGTWSSSTGGQFSPNNTTLNATYIPSKADSSSGSVSLKLTSDNNGLCASVSNSLVATITPVPDVKAGQRQDICSNNPAITLQGSVTGGASTGIWSGGSNNFKPNNTTLAAIYTPSATDLAAKKVTLKLTSTGNSGGTCVAVSDTVTFYFTSPPSLNVASTTPVCGDVASVPISATTNGIPSAFLWTTSGDGKFGNATSLSTTYLPTLKEKDANSVKLTLTTTAQGNCLPVNKSTVLTFTLKPSVNAGNPKSFCTGDSLVQLSATGASGKWTSPTAGSFVPSPTDQNAQYKLSATDVTNKSVVLTYKSDPVGACSSAVGTVKISIYKSTTVNPGAAKTVCSDQLVSLNGTATNEVGVRWSSTGSGKFIPNDSTKNVSYQPSTTEIKNGSAVLTLKALSSQCGTISKDVLVTINPKYQVLAGGPQTFCSDAKQLPLSGSRSGSFPVKWTKTGATGSFSPSDTVLNATFLPSVADLSSTGFTLTLSSNGIGCPNSTSTDVITILPSPKIKAGSNAIICNDTSGLVLKGTLLNSQAKGGSWSTDGGGTFSPNGLNAVYIPKNGETGTFKFVIATTGNGICNSGRDSLNVTIQDKPTILGFGGKVCADVDTISLSATTGNASGVLWTKAQATGIIVNPSAVNTLYLVSPADKKGGFISFKVKPLGIGVCKSVQSAVIFDITPPITVDAGDSVSYCSNTTQIPLTATVTLADSILWTTLGSGTFSNAKAFSTFYKPSSSDTATGKVKIVLTAMATALCQSKSDTVIITFNTSPKVGVLPDFDVCADTSYIQLGATSSTGMGKWTSDGSTSFSANAFDLKAKFVPSASDIKKGSVKFTFTSTNNGGCTPVSKSFTVTITPAPSLSAGVDQVICADAGSVKLSPTPNAFGNVKWTTTGFGKFQSTNSNTSTTANDSYLLSKLDTIAHQVSLVLTTTGVGKCKTVSDPVLIKITPAPFIDAGPSTQTICGDLPALALSGKVGNAKGGKWTSDGLGKFAPTDSSRTASYLITKADSAKGSVKIKFTTYGTGSCKIHSDSLNVTIAPAPKVSVGEDRTICADKDTVHLSGTKSSAKGVIWTSSGKGSFTPRADSVTTIYVLTSDDRKNGVTVRMAATGIGSCQKVSDSLRITVTPAPIVDAGIGTDVCASTSAINLDGDIKVATQGVWSTSGSGTFLDSSNLQGQYFPSLSDKTLKTVTLTLTSKDNGLCRPVSKKVIFTFTPAPEVSIGNDQTLCKDAIVIQLNGSFKNAAGGFWEAVGVAQPNFQPDNSQSVVAYVLSSADTANSNMVFKYTSFGSGKCDPVTKSLNVKFLPVPVVHAGENQTVCSDVQQILLSGTIRNAGTGTWQSSGNGTITASGNGLDASYIPTSQDIANGFVTFSLISQNNNGCQAGKDTMRVTILKAPQIVSIPSASICEDTAGVLISPVILDEGTILWTSTSGSGTFLPSPTSKNVTFIPSAEQKADGQANLVLTVNGSAVCGGSPVTSNTVIEISKMPSLSLSDISTCEGSTTVDLSAVQNNDIATKFQWSSLSAAPGTFDKSGQALSVQYTTSLAEQALKNSSIQLAFRTTQQGKCKPFIDTINVNFVPSPDVSAGDAQQICTNSDSIRLNASGSAGFWTRIGTGASGSFLPSKTALNASYFPSDDDKANTFIDLVFTSTPGGTCIPKEDTLHVDIKPGPEAHPFPTTDTVVCGNSGPIDLVANNSVNTKVTWTSDGSGAFGDITSNSTTYTPSAADVASGQILIKLKVIDDAAVCLPLTSKFNVKITPAPQVYAGNDMSICANAPIILLSGVVTKASIGSGIWSLLVPASGTFDSSNGPTSTKLDDGYRPTSSDVAAKAIKLLLTSNNNGKCNAVSDTLGIQFTDAPKVTVGGDATVCGDTAFIPLTGSISVVTSGQWTQNGQGFFTDTNQVMTRYIPSEDERVNGATIKFTLNSQIAGTCVSESGSFNVKITPKPSLQAGNGITACGDTAFVGLDGKVSNIGGIRWSVLLGTGTFQSNLKDTTSLLNDKYAPSAADEVSGQILLQLTSTNNGQCKAVTDFTSIVLTPAPLVDAGPDYTVCGNNRLIPLEGRIIQVATGGKWANSGSGKFLTKADSLVSSFLPSSSDSANGTTTFVLTSTGNGACKPARDTLLIKFTPVPRVNPGANIDTCADFASTMLNGAVEVALGGFWTTDGTGTLTDPSALTTEYDPSDADKAKGSVHFTLTSDGNGSCLAVNKTILLTITPLPNIFAGNDTTLCSNAPVINLSGTKNATVQAVKWSSGGSSTFILPVNQLSTSYSPDSADINANAVAFILESTQQGKCQPVQDVKIVNFQQGPKVFVSAGFPRTLCENNANITLDGKATNTSKTVWSIISTPNFITSEFGDSLALNTDFQPAITGEMSDTALITLRLTGYGIGQCNFGTSKDVVLTILPKPKIDLGLGDTIVACADKDTVHLNATIKIGSTPIPGFWTTTGTGVFEQNGFIKNTTYRLSKGDRSSQQIAFVFKSDGFGDCDTVFKYKILKLIPSEPTADAGPDQAICENNPVVPLQGQISVSNQFTWSNFPTGGSFVPPNSITTNYIATPSIVSAGAVKIKLTTNGPQNCKSAVDEMFATFTVAPIISIKADSLETCADSDSLQLNADIDHAGGGIWSSSGTGQFLPDATTLDAIYQPSLSDKEKGSVMLYLTSTDIGNCLPVSDSVVVTIRKAPESIITTQNNLHCVSQTGILLKGTPSTGSGVWTTSGTGSFSPNPNDTAVTYFPGFDDYVLGEVSLTFTTKENNTCKPVSQSSLVNVNTLPVADAGKDQKICIGSSTVISPIDEPNLTVYTWRRLTPTSANIDSIVFNSGILNTDASYQLTVEDTRGCRNVDTMEVKVYQRPQLNYASPYCSKDLIEPVTLPYDTLDGEFQWYLGSSMLNDERRSHLLPEQSGIYINTFTIFNCTVSDSTLVRPLPILSGVNQILCQNIQNDTIAMNLVPKNNGYTWSYSKLRSNVKSPLSGVKGNSFTQTIGTDTITFYSTVIDSTNICATTDSIIVFPIPSPKFAHLKDTIMCGGSSVTLNATPTNINSRRIQYVWQPGNIQDSVYTVTIPSNLTKSDTSFYIVQFELGQCKVNDSAKVIGNPLPMPNLPPIQYFCSYIPNSQEEAMVTLNAGSKGKILWNTGDTAQVIYTSKEGFYKVVITNLFGCTNSDSTTLIEQCAPTVYFPNAFSPNGDSRSDVFRVFGNKFVRNFKLMIFSRWGEIIFYMEDIDGNNVFEVSNKVYAWDGTYKGEQMPIGVYEYIATYEGKDEQYKGPYKKTGSVTILR